MTELFRAGANPDVDAPTTYPHNWPYCSIHAVQSGRNISEKVLLSCSVPMIRAFLDAGAELDYVFQSVIDGSDVSVCSALFKAAGRDAPAFARHLHDNNRHLERSTDPDDVALKELLAQYMQFNARVSLLLIFAALKLKILVIRARKRVWLPGGDAMRTKEPLFFARCS